MDEKPYWIDRYHLSDSFLFALEQKKAMFCSVLTFSQQDAIITDCLGLVLLPLIY
jgi:hypothetical protein